MPIGLPEGEKYVLAHVVGASDPVEINFNVRSETAICDSVRQTLCPFPDKLPIQDNSDSIPQTEDGGLQHKQKKSILPSISLLVVSCCIKDN